MIQKKQEYESLTIITPTLNEEENIGLFIETINQLYPKIRIIVADDGSRDKTQDIVKEKSKRYNVFLLDRRNQKVKGLTASIVDAIVATKSEFFICMDADLQHPPEKIKEVFEEMKHGADFVIATREAVVSDWPIYRRVISKIAIFMGEVRLLFSKFKHEDLMSGFFGGKTDFVRKFLKNKQRFEMKGYKVLFDLLKQFPNKTKLKRVYYTFGVRKRGVSKMGFKPIYFYLSSLLK